MTRSVALYGGNFDPPHNGHLCAVTQILAEPEIDEVWIVPSGSYREKMSHSSVSDRLAMLSGCFLPAFADNERVRIETCCAEDKIADDSTWLLIEYLTAKHPDTSFHFAIGAELVAQLPSWKYPEKLKENVSFLVIARPGSEVGTAPSGFRLRPLTLKTPAVFVSSSQIRSILATSSIGHSSVAGLAPQSVLDHIRTRGLYGQAIPTEERILYRGRFLELRDRGTWEYVHRCTGSSVIAIVAVTPENKIVLVEQYRPSTNCNVIELPAGLVGDDGAGDESALAAAKRELEEETGFQADQWALLAAGPPAAGLADEVVLLFFARGLTRVGKGGGVGHEQILVHEVARAELHSWFKAKTSAGCLVDPKVFAGIHFYTEQSASALRA